MKRLMNTYNEIKPWLKMIILIILFLYLAWSILFLTLIALEIVYPFTGKTILALIGVALPFILAHVIEDV